MKTIVAMQDLSEFEIRPSSIIGEYEDLVRRSAEEWFPPADRRTAENPFARGTHPLPAFERLGFNYVDCPVTASVFVSPRPDESRLISFFRESPAASFWRSRVLGSTGEARAEKVAQPRADWILDGIAENRPRASRLLDISPNGAALHRALTRGDGRFSDYLAAAPTADIDFAGSGSDATLAPSKTADIPCDGSWDVAVALDALPRAADARALADVLFAALAPQGLLFLTTPVSSGFETQVLWDNSPSFLPPDKLNVPSVEGILALFPKDRWEIIELSTPGMFDAEIVRRAVEADPGRPWPRFVRYLAERCDPSAQAAFQEFLQKHRLASYARMAARKVA